MTDTTKVEPALTAEEWERSRVRSTDYMIEDASGGCEYAKVIALANAALPDTDPHKITAKMVETLRNMWYVDQEGEMLLNRIADVLESYLPPRP